MSTLPYQTWDLSTAGTKRSESYIELNTWKQRATSRHVTSILVTFIYQRKENSGGVSKSLIDARPIMLRTLEYDFFEQKIRAFIPEEGIPCPKLLSPTGKAALTQEAFG
ncbi:hypothetical protein CGRA01v4_01155 [Colletotrichum graminicola]|uniref:Uncharacterized protein n=1 Tax=Colletotrichum graminicola (strain M1.001 / M2 / FGSC 10212) TaxID=645133 RepID=E3QGI3_COLGM|nr:uncharacterized protein GLRG_05115 [Colletotrichum graminicola M1.001]EFQ29971.1 hypothetical protein GLRG_05115 [Colletotrichum graminicola M1.001]WDK09877.1 hypothetical protein CGRA01v4_01155 [Colletotrichum graminicola]